MNDKNRNDDMKMRDKNQQNQQQGGGAQDDCPCSDPAAPAQKGRDDLKHLHQRLEQDEEKRGRENMEQDAEEENKGAEAG